MPRYSGGRSMPSAWDHGVSRQLSSLVMEPILGPNRPSRKLRPPAQLESIDFLADEALRTSSVEFQSGSSSARTGEDDRAPTPPIGGSANNFYGPRPTSGEESRLDRPHTGDGISGLPSLSKARNIKSATRDGQAKQVWGTEPSPFAGNGDESPSYHKKQQQKYTQMRAMRARVKDLENRLQEMQEQCDAAGALEKRAEKAEKRLREMGYDDMKKERAQSKSRIMKLEKSLARAKREVADYTKLKQQETKELHDKNKLLTQAAAQEKTANRVMSAKLVEMEAALKSALHRLSISEANSIREVQEKERMALLLQAQVRAREEADKARDSAQKAHSAAKFVQRAAQDELLMSRKKLASITEERNLANAKLARMQREQAEAAEKAKQEGYANDEKSRLSNGGEKITPTGKQIYRGGRRMNDRYLLFQVLQTTEPFALHFVSYQPEEAQEDFVTWTVEDVKRVIANTNEFLEVENIEDPDSEIIGIVPKKLEELLEILFDSIQAGFKQGELVLCERPEAEEHVFMREKEEVTIFRGIYKIAHTQLVFTVNEEWFYGVNQPPTLRFLAFNPTDEKEYELRLSPAEIEDIAPDFVGYRASEDMDNPLPTKAKVSRAKMGKSHENPTGIAPPVRHLFLYTLMDHMELSMTRSFTGTGVEVVEEKLSVRGAEAAVPYGLPTEQKEASSKSVAVSAEYGSVMQKTASIGQREAAAAARLTREPKTIQRTAKLLDGEMFTLTVNEYWNVADQPSSLLFTIFDPESEESAELNLGRADIRSLVSKAQQQRTHDAPASHLLDEESPGDRKDILHFLEERLKLEFRDETDFIMSAGRMHISFEQQKSEEDLALEREREAKQIEQILLATAEADKLREIYRFGWRLPHEGSRSETAEGGKHLMLRMLRLPENARGVEVRAVVAGGSAEGVELKLSEDQLLEMGVTGSPAAVDKLKQNLAGTELAELKDKYLQLWCRRLAVRLVLSADENTLMVRTPRPFVHEEVPIKCAVIEDEGLTRQEVMIVQVWRVEAEQDEIDQLPLGEINADAVRLTMWSPAIRGASDTEPKKGTSLALDLSAEHLRQLGLTLPQSTRPENSESVAERWVQQLEHSLELVPSTNIARPDPHTFGSVRLTTVQRTDVRSMSKLPQEILYQKSRVFGGERWLVSVRAPTKGQELLVSATPQKAELSTNLVLRLLVSGEKSREVGGPRALAECAQIRSGALHLPAPKLLHKGGLRLSNAYLIVSVFEEVAGPHEGGVRVEAYDFRTATMADLSLFKDELIALNLTQKSSGSALGYDSGYDEEEAPPVLDKKAISQLLEMLTMVQERTAGGKKVKRLTLRSMKELREKMELVARENAATSIQNSIRTRKAQRVVAEKKMAAEKHCRETTPRNLHRQGVMVEDTRLLLRIFGTIGEMESHAPVVHMSAMQVDSGDRHTMTVDGPAWADGQVAIKDFCKQLAGNLEFASTPEGTRVLRAKGSKQSAAMLQAAEQWRADPFKTFVSLLKENNADKLEFALSAVPGAVTERFAENHKPLHFAAANGNLEFVKLLVEHGADVNATTKENATPAMYAVPGAIASGDDGLGDEAREETLQYLLSRPEVDLTIRGTRGWCQGKNVQEIREAYGAASA